MAQITQPRLLAVALLVQPRVGIGGGFMCLVGAFMTVEVRTRLLSCDRRLRLRGQPIDYQSVGTRPVRARRFGGTSAFPVGQSTFNAD
jgi:hypothetical protein